ncbi:hypothetical protein KJ855_00610, partial [Patescibacteria group bacterium]|nr:hypothetical protein [Patescibacteria group bacterium]
MTDREQIQEVQKSPMDISTAEVKGFETIPGSGSEVEQALEEQEKKLEEDVQKVTKEKPKWGEGKIGDKTFEEFRLDKEKYLKDNFAKLLENNPNLLKVLEKIKDRYQYYYTVNSLIGYLDKHQELADKGKFNQLQSAGGMNQIVKVIDPDGKEDRFNLYKKEVKDKTTFDKFFADNHIYNYALPSGYPKKLDEVKQDILESGLTGDDAKMALKVIAYNCNLEFPEDVSFAGGTSPGVAGGMWQGAEEQMWQGGQPDILARVAALKPEEKKLFEETLQKGMGDVVSDNELAGFLLYMLENGNAKSVTGWDGYDVNTQ